MTKKEIALDLASFLDSDEARRPGASPAEVREIAEIFIEYCYTGLGKQPRLLAHEDVTTALTEGLPGRIAPRASVAEHVPAILRAYFDHLEATQVVTQAYEIGRALDESTGTFLEFVRSGKNAELQVRREQEPYDHGATKLGRNDPCSCGSGKKFKKCHGKNA